MKFTKSQQDILNSLSELPQEALTLTTPFHIARSAPSWWTWQRYEQESIETQYICGYARSGDGLVNRGILIRDKRQVRFYLTTHGVEYIKGLQNNEQADNESEGS